MAIYYTITSVQLDDLDVQPFAQIYRNIDEVKQAIEADLNDLFEDGLYTPADIKVRNGNLEDTKIYHLDDLVEYIVKEVKFTS